MPAPRTIAPEASVIRPFSVAVDCPKQGEDRASTAVETTTALHRGLAADTCPEDHMRMILGADCPRLSPGPWSDRHARLPTRRHRGLVRPRHFCDLDARFEMICRSAPESQAFRRRACTLPASGIFVQLTA